MDTVPNLKDKLAAFLSLANGTPDLIVNGVDLGLDAINRAHQYAMQQRDFEFAKCPVTVEVSTVTGGVLSPAIHAVTGDPVKVKKVLQAYVGTRPINFEQRTNQASALKRRWDMRGWDPGQIDPPNDWSYQYYTPTLVQTGQNLSLDPADARVWGGTVMTLPLDVIRYFDDYTDSAESTDFLLEHGDDFMFWYAVCRLNRKWKEFVPREEGNLSESSITTARDEAWDDLVFWDSQLTFQANSALNLD